MKRKKLTFMRSCVCLGWLAWGVGLLACSCSKESDAIISPGDDRAALIVPQASVGELVESRADLSGVVSGTTFPANTTKVFGLTAYSSASSSSDYSDPYFDNIAVNSGANSVLSLATEQLYPANGDELYFYAYSPMKGAVYTPGSGSAAPKVTWTLDGHTDVMTAMDDSGISIATGGNTQDQPALRFDHKLMQLKFKVMKSSAGFDPGKITAVSISNATKELTYDLSEQTPPTMRTGEMTVYSSATGQTITTTATYLGTNGSPFLTMYQSRVPMTVTCGGKNFAVTLNLPYDIGSGKICEVTLDFRSDEIVPTASITNWTTTGGSQVEVPTGPVGLVVNGIKLNSSSSNTVSRAGGSYSLEALTNTPATSNISWVVKDADGNEVGRSTAFTSYNQATVTFDENKDWKSRPLTLHWSYNGSPLVQYTGKITQNGGTIADVSLLTGQWNDNKIQTHVYAGLRTLQISGDYATEQKYYLVHNGTTTGPYSMSDNSDVKLPLNNTGSIIRWEIHAINASDNATVATDYYIEQNPNTYNNINTAFIFVVDTFIYLSDERYTKAPAATICQSMNSHAPESLTSDDVKRFRKWWLPDGNNVEVWSSYAPDGLYYLKLTNTACTRHKTPFEDSTKYAYCIPND